MKDNVLIKRILLIALAVTILLGIVLVALLLSTNDKLVKNIKLKENDIVQKNLEFVANGIHPGDPPKEYTLNITSKNAGDYDIVFDFIEEKNGQLKNFIDVTLEYEGTSYTYKLAELLDGQTVQFTCHVSNEPAIIFVRFVMPEEVGNEAQGTSADFFASLTITRAE